MPIRNLSPSQIDSFKSCHRKWYLTSVLGLKTPNQPDFDIGRVMHKFWERYHTEGCTLEDVDEMLTQEVMMDDETKDLIRGMVQNYLDYDKENPLVTPDVEQVIVEKELKCVTLAHMGVCIIGKPDMILVKKNEIVVVEHKTSEANWGLNDFFLKFQPRIYVLLGSQEFPGKKASYKFNIGYKRYPVPPKINKNNTVSKVSCTTTRAMYLEAIKSVGGNPDDYIDFLSKLPNYVFVERFPVGNIKPKNVLRSLVQIVEDMNRTYGRGAIPYGAENWTCKRCPFVEICASGGDDEEALTNAVSYYQGGDNGGF